jgi:hypothetical protein
LKKKNRERSYLAVAQQRSPSSRPNTPAPQPSPDTASSLHRPQDEAARWSSARHPIHRRLLDVRDEGRSPPSSIKDEPPPWENPRSSSFSPSLSSPCRPKTLAPTSSSAAAAGISKPQRAAWKLCHGPLVLLVKRIELESS